MDCCWVRVSALLGECVSSVGRVCQLCWVSVSGSVG